MRFFKKTNIKFMKYRKVFFLISAIMIIFSIYSLVGTGLNYGIDFAGGTQLILKYQEPVDSDVLKNIRSTLTEMNLGDVIVHEYGALDEKGNIYAVLARVEASSEVAREGDESGERVDIAELITERLRSEEDRRAITEGKKDLNAIGKAKLETHFRTTTLAPKNIPAYIDQLIQPTSNVELPPTPEEKFYKLLAIEIIGYRERADVGILRDFNELLAVNSRDDLVAENNSKPLDLINEDVLSTLNNDFYLGSFAVIGVEMVGPSVGSDLRAAAIASIISALIGILIYITIRFKFRFGIAAIIALIHDIIITLGIFAFADKEFTLPIVAALLTIVGYSLNDTIVVSDRIRENLNKLRRDSYTDVVNRSLNDTISRTVLTSMTTLFVVLCLLFLGGEVLNGFAFALMIGILIGTYSSICVVSPILILWHGFQDKYQKSERNSEYVKRSLKTLFPDQAAKKREKAMKTTSQEASDEAKDKILTQRKRSKKGITGKKKKKKKKRR